METYFLIHWRILSWSVSVCWKICKQYSLNLSYKKPHSTNFVKKLDNRLVIMKMSYFAKSQSDSAALRGSCATLFRRQKIQKRNFEKLLRSEFHKKESYYDSISLEVKKVTKKSVIMEPWLRSGSQFFFLYWDQNRDRNFNFWWLRFQ